MANQVAFLYRLLDKQENLLYVGVSGDVATRVESHRSTQEWGAEIASYTFGEGMHINLAYAQERDVIVLEKPRWNVAHNHRGAQKSSGPSRTSKEKWQSWYDLYAMKRWFSFAYTVEDVGKTFELPVFSLRSDQSIFFWKSNDGSHSVTVTPGPKGRATIHDKDILIYLVSQLVNGFRSGRSRSANRAVRIEVHAYLKSVKKLQGPGPYAAMMQALDRLCTTCITTDIQKARRRTQQDSAIIESWHVVDHDPLTGNAITVEITLSEWIFDVIENDEFFPIPYEYFKARYPIMRRIYELARENCQSLLTWTVDATRLWEMADGHSCCGSSLNSIYTSQNLPGYHLILDRVHDLIRIYPKQSTLDLWCDLD